MKTGDLIALGLSAVVIGIVASQRRPKVTPPENIPILKPAETSPVVVVTQPPAEADKPPVVDTKSPVEADKPPVVVDTKPPAAETEKPPVVDTKPPAEAEKPPVVTPTPDLQTLRARYDGMIAQLAAPTLTVQDEIRWRAASALINELEDAGLSREAYKLATDSDTAHAVYLEDLRRRTALLLQIAYCASGSAPPEKCVDVPAAEGQATIDALGSLADEIRFVYEDPANPTATVLNQYAKTVGLRLGLLLRYKNARNNVSAASMGELLSLAAELRDSGLNLTTEANDLLALRESFYKERLDAALDALRLATGARVDEQNAVALELERAGYSTSFARTLRKAIADRKAELDTRRYVCNLSQGCRVKKVPNLATADIALLPLGTRVTVLSPPGQEFSLVRFDAPPGQPSEGWILSQVLKLA